MFAIHIPVGHILPLLEKGAQWSLRESSATFLEHLSENSTGCNQIHFHLALPFLILDSTIPASCLECGVRQIGRP